MFSGIVSRAMTLEVLSTGVAGNYNGALQVVRIKIHAHTQTHRICKSTFL